MTTSLTLILANTIYHQDTIPAREAVPPLKSYFFKLPCYGRIKRGTNCYSVMKGANLQRNN